MRTRTALILTGLTLWLAACERREAPPPPPPKASPAVIAARPPAPWFICDAINTPAVLVVSKPDTGGQVTILTIDKADLHPPVGRLYTVGAEEGAAGNVYRPLSRDGAAVGHVRALNPGMLGKPEEATTQPVTEVKLEDATFSCRWLTRTRLFGVAAGRTVLVTDADDGPLLRTFDFKAPPGGRVMPDGAQRSSAPSLRMAGGKRDSEAAYTFANEGYGYAVDAGGVSVTQNGRATSSEPFIAVQRGEATASPK